MRIREVDIGIDLDGNEWGQKICANDQGESHSHVFV